MINIIRPELLDITDLMLKKIVYYGRFNVFEILFENIPYKILDIISKSNPLDLKIENVDEFSYIEDIWNDHYRFEEENEKPIISPTDINHEKLINLIISIGREKYYNHICWTESIKIYWIKLAIDYSSYTTNQDKHYFIKYEKLIEMFNLKFDFTDKTSIKQHIQLFGKEITWKYIININDANFLNLLD